MNVAVIGLGLIGGSMALDLNSQLKIHVVGVDSNRHHAETAIRLGLVNKVMSLEEAMSMADVLLLATPVDVIQSMLPGLLDQVGRDQWIIDVGSTKLDICSQVAKHPNRSRYIAAHPLAGTEYSGPEAAIRSLFSGKKNIICHQELSDPEGVHLAKQLFNSLGMTTYFMTADEHDKHLAYVSHLSHVTSFTLGLTVLDIEKDEKQIFNLASTGFASTARLAKSNPDTWSAIFNKNGKHLVEALDQYINKLEVFKKAIALSDKDQMETLMKEANEIGRFI